MQKSEKMILKGEKNEKSKKYLQNTIKGITFVTKIGPVVQLNRTSDSGSESRGFESRRGHKM